MNELLKLKSILNDISDLKRIIAVLSWDQQTYMPHGGNKDRGDQLALVGKLSQEISSSSDLAKQIESS